MKKIIFITVLLLASAASFVFGARYGVYEHYLMNSSVEAALLTGELEALRKGNVETLILSKEVKLDGLIATHGIYLEEGKPWLFWPISEAFNHQDSLKKVVTYRTQHPIVTPNSGLRRQAEKVLKDVTP